MYIYVNVCKQINEVKREGQKRQKKKKEEKERYIKRKKK